ncbi:MAG: hypothetical protein Q3M30_19465 [Candidatus Electrothrix sp. Rat3]|nr:hypothetical protein [Candidatus Electrothrix rattekaaiensis]
MRKKLVVTITVCCTLFFAGQLFAQCQANLINYTEVVHIFKEAMCGEAIGKCYAQIAQLQASTPDKYPYAYCDIGSDKKVVKRADRCQRKNQVRCTIKWSDGTIDSYDEFCLGCIGEGMPSPVPCDWPCPFPER